MKEESCAPDAGVRRATLVDEGDNADPPQLVLGEVWAYIRDDIAGRAKSPDGRRRGGPEAQHQSAAEKDRTTGGREGAMAVSALHECILSCSRGPMTL